MVKTARIFPVICGLFVGAAQSASNQPNIVLINADDLEYGDLSCYGATRRSFGSVKIYLA